MVEIEDYFIEAGEWDPALNHPGRVKSCAQTIGQMPSAWTASASGQHERVMTDPPCRLVFSFDGKRVLMLRVKHTHRQHP